MADIIDPRDLLANELRFERRNEKRLHRALLVSYRPYGRFDRPLLTVTYDASVGGMAIKTAMVLPRDLMLSMKICRPGSLEVFRARGRVAWSLPLGAGARTGIYVLASTDAILC